ncbi:MAG TPA: TonB-dependent receptor [Bacteroidota bacterium]|nr:TonB-dependent receptor [Bacteroidota bacterium]
MNLTQADDRSVEPGTRVVMTRTVHRKHETLHRTGFRLAAVPFSLLLIFFGKMSAQQDSTQKAEPEMRRIEIPVTPADSTEPSVKSKLPKFDLPEYVVTGDASINVPALRKVSASDDADEFSSASLLNPPLVRSRVTSQAPLPVKEATGAEHGSTYTGTASAELGTFFSPQAELWFGRTFGTSEFSLSGRYARSRGFAPFTDRSGGNLAADGGTTLTSDNPNFDQAKLRGNLEYRSDDYNWYGTSHPSVSRNRANLALSAGLSNWGVYSIPYAVGLGVNSFQVSDSSANITETTVRADASTRFSLSSIPLSANVRLQRGSIATGASSTGLTYIDASVSGQRYEWQDWSIQGSLHGYLADGMGGQHLLRLSPHLDGGYRVSQAHTLRASVGSEVEPASLSASVRANRYLSAESQIRYPDDQLDGAFSLESEWSSRVSTKLEVRGRIVADEPLYADTTSRGVWQLAYGGKTSIATISGGIFAKLPANDYFASDFVATFSHNPVTGHAVPYTPGLQLECRYGRQVAEGLRGIVTLTLIHVRSDNVLNVTTLPSILLVGLKGQYRILTQAELILDVENLLNQTYEYWRGYQEYPFVVSAGVSIRW